ncbi:MAG: hypothetical protein COA63_009900 [Methylophaga sp.]|nr:hypothetical protein [Methylophaga sp.]
MSHYSLKAIFLWLCLSFFIVACGQKPSAEKAEMPQLNDSNIHAFSLSLSKDYYNTVDKLITAYKSHKQSDDSYGFTQFRNNTWTPAYIKEKKFYQSVYQQNKAYINASNTKPLFLAYENLIYIGVDLKNSLLNKNGDLEKEALASLKQDKTSIKAILNAKK